MKPQRVLVLVHKHLVPPADVTGLDPVNEPWRTEYDVLTALRQRGHEVEVLGVQDELGGIRTTIEERKPTIVFNLLEAFDDVTTFDQNVVSYLELLRMPYTGCNPRGLLLARDKALSKKLLAYHRVPVPEFAVFKRGRPIQVPSRLPYPLIVKSLTQEASIGIAQASVVADEEKLRQRVAFIHQSVKTHAIAERYVAGRELYVGILGNDRLRVFPIWEMRFEQMQESGNWPIATERVKWNEKYQQKHGIRTGEAHDLPDGLREAVRHLAKRVYRTLELSGYARIDLRLDAEGRVFVLEANPNPQIAHGEDFAESAGVAGVGYGALLDRILALGLHWRPELQV